jgi:hypothetical protein
VSRSYKHAPDELRFWALVTLTRESPVTGIVRYMPNINFDLPGVAKVRFGLTILDKCDWPLVKGEAKRAHFTMLRNAELDADLFDALSPAINVGAAFSLFEGPRVVGNGIIQEVEDLPQS